MKGRKFAHEPLFTVLRGGRTHVVCKCDGLRVKVESLEVATTAYGLHTALAGIQEKKRRVNGED